MDQIIDGVWNAQRRGPNVARLCALESVVMPAMKMPVDAQHMIFAGPRPPQPHGQHCGFGARGGEPCPLSAWEKLVDPSDPLRFFSMAIG